MWQAGGATVAMPLSSNADIIVVRGFWLDEVTGQGVRTPNSPGPGTVTFTPLALNTLTGSSKTPNLRDLTFSAFIKTRQRVATVHQETGYFATLMVASNDPDLDSYGGRLVQFSGEDPFVIQVPHNAPLVSADQNMVSALQPLIPGIQVGDEIRAVWLTAASLVTTPVPTPPVTYLTAEQTLETVASGMEAHDGSGSAHPDIRASIAGLASTAQLDAVSAGIPEAARDALGSALVAGANVSIVPDDGANTITISATVPASYSDEQAQDAFAALIAAGTHSGVSFSYNDAGNAISATVAAQSWSQITGKPSFATVATSGSASDITTGTLPDSVIPSAIARDSEVTSAVSAASTTDRARANHTGTQTAATISDFTEAVQDAVAALLGAGSNITLNYDDAGNTLTVSASGGGGGGLDAEAVRDTIGVALVGTGNITVTVNDALDTITVTTTATANSTDAQLRDRSTHTGTQAATTITGLSALATSTDAANLTGTVADARIPAGIARDSEVTSALADRVPAIVLTPTGVAATDGPAMDAAVTAALADKRPIYMRPGTYRRTTAWDCRGDGLTIHTGGVRSVTIEQQTDNTPVMRVGRQQQDIGGLTLTYTNPQPATNTAANCVEFYKSYLSSFGPLFCYRGARGLHLAQANYDLGNGDSSGNYVFSCHFELLRIARYSICAVDLQSFNSTSTGCTFDNIYTINEDGGTTYSADRALNLLAWDEVTVRQLNIEGVTITSDAPIVFNQCRTGKISGLHFERVKLTSWGAGFLNVYNNSRFTVDGMSIVFCPFANAAGGQADLLGLVKMGDGCQLELVGFNTHDCSPLTAPERPLVVGWDITSPLTNAKIRLADHAGLTTTAELINTPIGGTAPQLPVVKQLNDEWRHYTEAGKNVTFGTAAPTTGTWAVGDKRWNTAPVAAGAPGWVCTTAGTPGTWKAMAALAA